MANYLIIAATSDIGQELSRNLHAQGHSLYLTGRDEGRLAAITDELGSASQMLNADDFDATDAAISAAQKSFNGELHGIVCMAGSVILKGAHLTSRTEYEATLRANLDPAFATVRAAGKHMKQGGSVVLLGTAAAMQGIANHEAIAAAKGAIISLAQSAAATYALQGLRFNTVCPGLTETRLTEKLTANATSRKFSEAMHTSGKLGKPRHVANMIAFLLQPENDWMTGQTIGVDGGLSRVMPKVKA